MRLHRNAVIAQLETRLPGAVFKSYTVAKGEPVRPSRYAVVFIGRSSKPRTRFTGGQWQDKFTVTIHSVGVDEDSALWVEERVSKLTGAHLMVADRNVWPVAYVTGQPVDLNDAGVTPLWFAVSQFDITSDPI